MALSQNFNRVICSLTNVGCDKRRTDILFKTVTSINIAKKVGYLLTKKEMKQKNWSFTDCIVRVKFFDMSYRFNCPTGFDFNIFMNPFFHENDITTFVYYNIEKTDTFIDVGAHGGLYTIIASIKAGPTGKVVSIEPNPENIKHLKNNIKINDLKNVKLIPKAAAEKEKKVKIFYCRAETSLTSILTRHEGDKCSTVETTTLDNVGKSLEQIKMIKIDTEGYDMNILKGGKNILPKTKYVIVEQHSQDIKDFLTEFGYKTENMQPSGYLLATNSNI